MTLAVIGGSAAIALLSFGMMRLKTANRRSILDEEGLPESAAVVATPDFDSVRLNGAFDVTLRVGEPSLIAVYPPSELGRIQIQAVNGQLSISGDRVSPGTNLELDTPSLSQVENEGSGRVRIQIERQDSLSVLVSGNGDLGVTGDADSVDAHVTGAGSFRGETLRTNHGVVQVSGSGSAWLIALQTLDVEINGSGNVLYYGVPKVTRRITGSGKVMKGPGSKNLERTLPPSM